MAFGEAFGEFQELPGRESTIWWVDSVRSLGGHLETDLQQLCSAGMFWSIRPFPSVHITGLEPYAAFLGLEESI